MTGNIYVISGPSGAGKSTIIKLVVEQVGGIGYSISHTSRRPRGGEEEGVHYHFVDRKTFKGMIEKEAFAEWAEVYGDLYGTSFESLRGGIETGLDVIMDVDTQGAGNIKKHFPESTLIYILPPSLNVLEARLKGRATDEASVIRLRLDKARRELKACRRYDYLVINDDLEEAVGNVASIVRSRRCMKERVFPDVKERFEIF